MVMTCQEYSQYLRGYTQAAVRELPSMQGNSPFTRVKGVTVAYDDITGNFLVGVGAHGFAVTEYDAFDNVGENRIDEEVKRLFEVEGVIARISEIEPHPVANAIAAPREPPTRVGAWPGSN